MGTHGYGETTKTLCGDRIQMVQTYGETVTHEESDIDCIGCRRELDLFALAPVPAKPVLMSWIP